MLVKYALVSNYKCETCNEHIFVEKKEDLVKQATSVNCKEHKWKEVKSNVS